MTASRLSRLAPSPTGALHLGNARTFLVNWALARRARWRLVMRIEDLDGPRVKPEAAAQAIKILEWLGLDFDGEPRYQSHDLEPYRSAMRRLAAQRRVYGCTMSRTEVEAAAAASAPHADGGKLRFPPELRPQPGSDAYRFGDETINYRFVTPPRAVTIDDAFAGRSQHDPAAEVGDFVVWTKRGVPAYQLAVVVDDLRDGVTDVVRGDDLLPSAARQTLLYEALGEPPPRWWHLPLVVGPDGRRLAKRHGDTRLDTYRQRGAAPTRLVGLLAFWCGVTARREEMDAAEFARRLDLSTMSRMPITFTSEDDRWLCTG